MRRGRRTLDRVNLDELDRILATVCDVIDGQGGDWAGTEAALRRTYGGEELEHALSYAATLLVVYAEPGGPAFLRGMRDRRRRLVPVTPGQRRGWRWKATG